ncbi:hypothetical protein HPB50_001738 [Hyalomma asiaticum]|uniref:Uncharacterized protein n=1 Tax=Hyalomma asiaticum TaxID=266040 RepID=A0ACB7RLW8_HYAAI|nr:hypothetical protein HPB50_001738 [Hyalomma asiaticum]
MPENATDSQDLLASKADGIISDGDFSDDDFQESAEIGTAEEEGVMTVCWYDNGPVNMVSTFVGLGNTTKVKRWSESTKQHVDIDCPQVIAEYNQFPGGVDKADFLMALYPLQPKAKKWPKDRAARSGGGGRNPRRLDGGIDPLLGQWFMAVGLQRVASLYLSSIV